MKLAFKLTFPDMTLTLQPEPKHETEKPTETEVEA